MKQIKDEIEQPVEKSPWLLFGGVLVLLILLILGIFLLVEALKIPDGPQDVLDMKRMLFSGLGVLVFSVAVFFFLLRMFKTTTKSSSKRKPTKRKAPTKRK